MHYQPIIETATGNVARVEALARMQDAAPDVTPTRFISDAESSGLIHGITTQTIALVLADRETYGRGLPVAVNLSERVLAEPDFCTWFVAAFERVPVDFRRLTLELPDGAQSRTDAVTRENVRRLRERGVRFSLDGFGLDLSQWSHVEIEHSGVAELKVHGDLVALIASSRTAVLLESVMDIARRYELDVVAKNVESDEALEIARARGCNLAQGFAIARPMPAAELATWLVGRSIDEPPPERPNVARELARKFGLFR